MLVVGNWKMNGLRAESHALCQALLAGMKGLQGVEVVLCPPATLLAELAHDYGTKGLHFGGQDCHAAAHGAHTGDVSAEMLTNAGAKWAIVGHSERRAAHAETDEIVCAKAKAALRAHLKPIVCIGETLEVREAGQAEALVRAQLAAAQQPGLEAVAYEPVWAIGTGKVASVADIRAMHAAIHAQGSHKLRVLYGGSVKAENAEEVLACEGVDGVLVGGASLKADEFLGILRAAAKISALKGRA